MKKIFLIGPLILLIGCGGQNFSLPSQDNTFQQLPKFNNKVDILFMADDSSNMMKYQNRLAGQMSSMLSVLDSMGMDYRIAVTSSSLGSGFSGGKLLGNPKYVSRSTANKVDVLVNRMITGQSGSDLEQGLGSVKTALSSSDATTFIRSDALLAVIVLSNEDDYSSGNLQSYIDYFEALKQPFENGARSWILNFLGVTSLDPSCPTQTGVVTEYIEVGVRYMQIANFSGGVSESICGADWSQVVTNVRVRINQVMSDYYLNRQPVVSSITVTINSQPVPKSTINGWSYHEKIENGVTKYFVRFNGSYVPTFYDVIKVNWDPAAPM